MPRELCDRVWRILDLQLVNVSRDSRSISCGDKPSDDRPLQVQMTYWFSIIGCACDIIRRRGAVLLAASLWPFALSFIAIMLVVRTIQPAGYDASWDSIQVWQSMNWLMRWTWIVSYICYCFLSPMLALAGISEIVSADHAGTGLSFGSVLHRVMQTLSRVILLAFAVGFLASFGLQFFVLPGLAVIVITTFAVPAIMLEGKGMRSAWRRSAVLVRQRRSAVVILYGGLLVTLIAIFSVIFVLRRANEEATKLLCQLCFLVVPVPIAMLFGTLNTLLFLDIRNREGTEAAVQRL